MVEIADLHKWGGDFLQRQRDKLDELDTRLLQILADRFAVTRAIGLFKAHHQLPARDPARESLQDQNFRAQAIATNLDPDLASAILRLVLD